MRSLNLSVPGIFPTIGSRTFGRPRPIYRRFKFDTFSHRRDCYSLHKACSFMATFMASPSRNSAEMCEIPGTSQC